MERRKKRRKQLSINRHIRNTLFGHLVSAICYYCDHKFDMKNLTIEHIIPLCLGGTNDASNIALACKQYNQEKGKEAWNKAKQLRREVYESQR